MVVTLKIGGPRKIEALYSRTACALPRDGPDGDGHECGS
jgi:hypothetical protein